MEAAKAKILVVEDEKSMREVLRVLLESEGYEVVSASNGVDGLGLMEKDIFDLIITDIKMPGADGFAVLKKSMELSPDTLVVMITAFGTTEAAVEAMKLGAYDYVHKPFKIDEIRLIVKNALDKRRLKAEVSILREKVKTAYVPENIIGKSPAIQEILRILPRIAENSSNVLITGESGTGKEIIANAIHNMSRRKDRSLVAINCASLPEGLLESELFGHMKGAFTGAHNNKQGLFEVADRGTLFLDEVVEMPVNLQSKLLRAIENGSFRRLGGTSDVTVDVRIISATNRDPKEAVKAGLLREDLYYRLNAIPLHLPALRERKEDIPLFIDYFLKKFSPRKIRLSNRAVQMLINHSWHGNVRELENAIEQTVLFTDSEDITESNLPQEITDSLRIPSVHALDISKGIDLECIMEDMEKTYLLEALKTAGGRKMDAAKLLGLSFRSFRHRLAKYGIK
jgi:two-component system response regulator PilR (NtrC family)